MYKSEWGAVERKGISSALTDVEELAAFLCNHEWERSRDEVKDDFRMYAQITIALREHDRGR